jgi:hypothetical protein
MDDLTSFLKLFDAEDPSEEHSEGNPLNMTNLPP